MNQIKIGKFIAKCRKKNNLTQIFNSNATCREIKHYR